MCCPSSLWTAAHEKIPILYIVHNNRAWHQEIMGLQVVANRMQRGADRTHIGTTIRDPDIDYAKMAQSMGAFGQGPITDPNDFGPAIKKAVDIVKRGAPALIDVVAQGRRSAHAGLYRQDPAGQGRGGYRRLYPAALGRAQGQRQGYSASQPVARQ